MSGNALKLSVPLLASALLLTACPGVTPPTIRVPSDPGVLNGHWSGTLAGAVNLAQPTYGDGRLYLIRSEGAHTLGFPYGGAGDTRRSLRLLALDAATGSELMNRVAPRTFDLGWSPKSAGEAAALYSLAEQGSGMSLSVVLNEIDPATLVTRSSRVVPASTGASVGGPRLGRGGQWLLIGDRAPLSTATLTDAPLPATVREQLELPRVNGQRSVTWAFDEAFLGVSVAGATPKSMWTTSYYATDSGNAFDGAPKHPAACNLSAAQFMSPSAAAPLPGGGAALAYDDGSVEFRNPDDSLNRVERVGGCAPVLLRADGETLTFLDTGSSQIGTIAGGVTVSQPTRLPVRDFGQQELVAAGQAVMTGAVNDGRAVLAIERVDGAGWNRPDRRVELTLDTVATWQSKTRYTFEGRATLNGETLTVSGVADSGSAVFEPETLQGQAAPPIPVTWTAELRGIPGQPARVLRGAHFKGSLTQIVTLEFPDVEQAFAFAGTLKSGPEGTSVKP